ncbi:MAG: DNA translocase FtsK, partial [Synergistes sp.]|nr:DNA translocase FtsK [Synergistes sp.]
QLPVEESNAAKDFAEEEEIDYNDPESVKRAEEYEAQSEDTAEEEEPCDTVQDPNFSYDSSGAGHIKQGIFPPPADIFGPPEAVDEEMDEEKAGELGGKIVSTLSQFGIESQLAEILVGPTVIQFRIQLAPGVKVSKVAALSNDIALAMAVSSLRIEAPIPGKPYVGIEIPNPKRRGIPLRTVIEGRAFSETELMLPLPFGVAVNGEPVVVGLEELPHLLVAGTTGSGKSVFVNSCIVGLCSKRTPAELRMILVDPKRVEMAVYDKLPHLLTPPVTDPKKAVQALAWLIREMERRYSAFAKLRVRNLTGYNEKVLPKDRIPHIVVVVDELADLMMTAAKEVEEYICRLAQMARATGIHLMLATQRPSVNIITGLIKANIPARVAFTLPSNADSRTIIDCAGAEKLLGKGDMLFSSTKHPKPIRVQSPWIADQVLADWLRYMTNTFGEPSFIRIEDQGSGSSGGNGGSFDDELLEEAVETVLSTGIASASGLQRRLRVGFSRASRLIDMMEQLGIVGAADGARPREILVDEDTAKEILEDAGCGGGTE